MATNELHDMKQERILVVVAVLRVIANLTVLMASAHCKFLMARRNGWYTKSFTSRQRIVKC